MKSKLLWFVSFVLSVSAILLSVFAYNSIVKTKTDQQPNQKPSQNTNASALPQTYYEPSDNVGAVSFTEDQITELARNIFFIDDYLKDVVVSFEQNKITIAATIKNKQKLLDKFPRLQKYNAVITGLVDKPLKISASIKNKQGRAELNIDEVSVADVLLDSDIVSPFIKNSDFSKLFDIDYKNIEIADGSIIFTDDLPKLLQF